MTIQQRIEANESGLNRLFGKYNIKARGLEGIREGAERFGAVFVGRAADVLNDNSIISAYDGSSSYENDPNFVGPPSFDYGTASPQKKNIWDQLNNALDFVNNASNAIGNFRQNATGYIPQPEYVQPETNQPNYLLIGAGLVVVVILILIFKK